MYFLSCAGIQIGGQDHTSSSLKEQWIVQSRQNRATVCCPAGCLGRSYKNSFLIWGESVFVCLWIFPAALQAISWTLHSCFSYTVASLFFKWLLRADVPMCFWNFFSVGAFAEEESTKSWWGEEGTKTLMLYWSRWEIKKKDV